MKLNCKFILITCTLLISACATEPTAQPPTESNSNATTPNPTSAASTDVTTVETVKKEPSQATEVQRTEEIKLTTLELQKFAYELGFNPKKEITETQKQEILNRKKLRQLERSLDSQKERLQYSKVLPWLNHDLEKIEVLSIPTVEGRQGWINKNKIWSRTKELKNFDEVVESQDIALGMPAEYVRRSWGEPSHIETSGNPIYKNERWQYLKQVSTPQGYKQEKRSVYFEGGRVAGWETE
ncbi:MAG: hypothetical protein AABY53_00450 [Bdellovibrionota bacterium]